MSTFFSFEKHYMVTIRMAFTFFLKYKTICRFITVAKHKNQTVGTVLGHSQLCIKCLSLFLPVLSL